MFKDASLYSYLTILCILSWDYSQNAAIYNYCQLIYCLNLVNENSLRSYVCECCNYYYVSHLISLFIIFSRCHDKMPDKSNLRNEEFILSFALGGFLMVELWQCKCVLHSDWCWSLSHFLDFSFLFIHKHHTIW